MIKNSKRQKIIIIILFFNLISIVSFSIFKKKPSVVGGITPSNLGRMAGTSYALYYWKLFPIVVKPITTEIKYDMHNSTIYPVKNTFIFEKVYARNLLKKLQAERDITQVDILHGPEDFGIVFLIMLSSLLRGKFYPITIKPVNLFFYLISFFTLFFNLIKDKNYIFAITISIVLMFHGNIYNSINNENISVYPLLAIVLLAGIYTPIVFNRKISAGSYWIRLSSSTLILLFFVIIRGLAFPVVFSMFLSIVLYNPENRAFKRVLINNLQIGILIVGAFFIIKAGFMSLIIPRCQFVSSHNLNLPLSKDQVRNRFSSHPVLHSIWCGLGDFGKDKGYRWDDKAAYAFALNQDVFLKKGPQDTLEQVRYGTVFRRNNTLGLIDDEMADVYFDIKRYNSILLHKIVTDITSEPFWYPTILVKRLFRIMNYQLLNWIVCLLFFVLLLKNREKSIYKSYLRLFLFFSVFITVPLFIYSRKFERYFLGTDVALAVLIEFTYRYLIRKIPFLEKMNSFFPL